MMYQENKEAIKAREARRSNPINLPSLSDKGGGFSLSEFTDYYKNRFPQDLRRYYDFSNNTGEEAYPVILHMAHFGAINARRNDIIWDDVNHFFMFSVSVFYTALCSQVIGHLYGWKQMENFLSVSNLPLMNCGMGGLMHPIQVMLESELYPPMDFASYMNVLEGAGIELTQKCVNFFHEYSDAYSRNYRNMAYRELLYEVDTDEIEAEIEERAEEYMKWLMDPTTKYASIYVCHEYDQISMSEYLKTYKEEMPDWLNNYKPGDKLSFDMIMSSRIGYYPGSGSDGDLVAIANKAHCTHSYLYVDYCVKKEDIISEVDANSLRGYHSPFRGYHSIGRFDWAEHDITPNGQYPLNINYIPREHPMTHVDKTVKPYCFTEILERDPELGDEWGAKRFAVTFLFADGIMTYYQVFVMQYAKAPWILLLQDHGFGLNYDRFGNDGFLGAIVREFDVYPKFVICGIGTKMWDGYKKLNNVKSKIGGMCNCERWLYKKK